MIIAVGFTACTNEDNSVVTSSPEVVVGKWYYELNQHDTFRQTSRQLNKGFEDLDGVVVVESDLKGRLLREMEGCAGFIP